MSENKKLVDLTKKVKVVLDKKQIPNTKAQVGFAVDVSGSIEALYRRGTMQSIINRLQAIAMRFDDNETLDMWCFDTAAHELPPATPDLFDEYVNKHIMTKRGIWGGTKFAPALDLINKHYYTSNTPKGFFGKLFGKSKPVAKELPVYLVFLTDGENSDTKETIALVDELEKHSIYIQFVGVGTGTNFSFIRRLAEEKGHVGFVDFSNPSVVTDEQMFEELLNDEFVNWAKSI